MAAPEAADRMVERARVGGGGRLRAAVTDFFLDPALRLTEQERALMTAMLQGLIGSLADEMRVRVPDHLARVSECDAVEIMAELTQAGLLAEDGLVAVLLKRADAARVAQAGDQEAARQMLSRLVSDDDPAVAAAAMALALARGRRRDRIRLGIGLDDLPSNVAEQLVHAIAAALALRADGSGTEFASAAVALLDRHDPAHGLDETERRLVAALHDAGRLDDELVLSLSTRGEASLMVHALARRAEIPAEVAWELLMQPGGGRLALLLRLAGQPRTTAAALFVSIGPALGLRDPAAEIDRFDALSEDDVAGSRSELQRPAAYRNALEALGRHG